MKKLFFIVFVFIGYKGNSQVNLNELTTLQWQEDLDYLTDKVEKKFAGFTPELKTQFKSEAGEIRSKIPMLSVNQRIMEFARLMAMLNDGHTEISILGRETNFHRLPLSLYYFGNDLRIVGATESQKNLLGARLLKIEDLTTLEVFEKLKPYMNCDNSVEYIATGPTLMTVPEILEVIGALKTPGKVKITVVNDLGVETTEEVVAMTSSEISKTKLVRLFSKAPIYLENSAAGYWYKYIPESKIMYLNITTLFNLDGKSSIKKVMKEMLDQFDQVKAEKLVVDFRLARGGNYHNVLPLIEEVKKRPSLNRKGNLFVINGRVTFSAASVATVFFKETTQALVLGEISRTRANWADNAESYSLPNSKLGFACTEKMKTYSQALGNSATIPVDIEIPRSYEHYKEGRDEVMEYIQSLKN